MPVPVIDETLSIIPPFSACIPTFLVPAKVIFAPDLLLAVAVLAVPLPNATIPMLPSPAATFISLLLSAMGFPPEPRVPLSTLIPTL